jgi:predicted Fe-Mo cluster-binding NifX family protein
VKICIGASGTVGEAVEAFKAGTLKSVEKPNVEGHWV